MMRPRKQEVEKQYSSKIYIIESPSTNDVEVGINEGQTLSSAFKLARLNNAYFIVNDRESFIETFNKIASEIKETLDNKTPMPFLHFSLHGNKNGIGLTNNDFIDWKEFRKILMKFNHEVGFVKDNFMVFSRVSISMSVCWGIYAMEMFIPNKLPPFYSLIGPTEKVDWVDSLVAFVTFYHNLVYKRSTIMDSLSRMNTASGTNTFKNFLDIRLNHEK